VSYAVQDVGWSLALWLKGASASREMAKAYLDAMGDSAAPADIDAFLLDAHAFRLCVIIYGQLWDSAERLKEDPDDVISSVIPDLHGLCKEALSDADLREEILEKGVQYCKRGKEIMDKHRNDRDAAYLAKAQKHADSLAAELCSRRGSGNAAVFPDGCAWKQEADKLAGRAFEPVYCGSAKELRLGNASFTCAAWCKLDKYGGDDPVFLGVRDMGTYEPSESVSRRKILHLNVRGRRYYFGFGWCDAHSNVAARLGQWDHVAWRYDAEAGMQAIIVNGKVVLDRKNEAYDDTDNETIQLGMGWMGSFQGTICGGCIFNRPLDSVECITLADATMPNDYVL